MNLCICMFAHNEELSIVNAIETIVSQDVFQDKLTNFIFYILINGSTDLTYSIANEYIIKKGLDDIVILLNVEEKGKSRSWNFFVHKICPVDADLVVFCDADINIEKKCIISKMVSLLKSNKSVIALNSKPVKDLGYTKAIKTITEKLIYISAGGFSEWKHSICGQLYCVRYDFIKKVHMPAGLPVEDGYVGAAILTDNFNCTPKKERIIGIDDVYHVYESESNVVSLIKHQVRIVVGSSINYALFTHLGKKTALEREKLFHDFDTNDEWLSSFINSFYPKWFGWVPFHFLFKRTLNTSFKRNKILSLFKALLGFFFDLIVYLMAQWVMFRKKGPGFW